MNSEKRERDDRSDCKIDRVAAKYGLEYLDADIRHRRRKYEDSLRDLEAYVNVRILDAAMQATDVDVVGDATSVYEVLIGENVDTERRVDIQDQLQTHGIDVDELESDFISYQTVRTHLNDCIGMDTSRRGIESIEEGREIIRSDRQRHRQIVSRTVARLSRLGLVHIESPNITVSATIECEACNSVYRVQEFLERGQCDCSEE